MRQPTDRRRPAGRRRRLGAIGAALSTLAVTIVTPLTQAPAQAADTVVCGSPASVFAAETGGIFWRYPLNSPGETTSGWQTRVRVGGGWNTFGRVVGGPDNRVYGINANGLTRYRWIGPASNWELVDGKQNWVISTDFKEYATAALRDKITVDESGDFYTVDATGRLRWHRFDETARSWVVAGRVIDTGWDRYNLIVAGSTGVLYARAAADGRLFRYRFDPVSQRWLDRDRLVGTGWQTFTKGVFSVGGDTLFGIKATGAMNQYRFREDNNTWAVQKPDLGAGWAGFGNVAASTNTCRLNVSHTPTRPVTTVQSHAPTGAMQAAASDTALGTLEYAYTDNIGQLRHGRQNPDDFNSVQWTTVSDGGAYTGKPALTDGADKRVHILSQSTTSDARQLTQTTAGTPAWNPWTNLAGAMKSTPAAVRLSDNTLVVFALDADGAVWSRRQDGPSGDLMAWRKLGGTGFTGNPVVTASADRSAILTVTDAAGTVHTATYRDGTLGTFTSLGGTGFTGTPAVVTIPGFRLMLFARHTSGPVMAQLQHSDGTFPGTWTPVGDDTITPVGSPTAVLSPNTGLVSVLTRTPEGIIYYSAQTAQGADTWRNWIIAKPESVIEPYPTDPTMFTYTSTNGTKLAFVVRTAANSVRLYEIVEPTTLLHRTARQTAPAPTFVERPIPQPPTD
ncbi:tachylectin-related carbohydrate-binding protein [Phytohabitans flavus]|uniref:Uncharacterized protein n=1 Tax=Phytohabitans flavus TaxID=1076124 RepID=A0A6F8XSX2_9ACTN|nr:tachylectin-related carbohydrate-binding protein [Phytohabitans flavus]BCB76934.1 hypothetical protein Pflav_033440 [Phytohabitans flavus]